MKRIIFLLIAFCTAFFCITASAQEITEYDTAADNANSWRYENGQLKNDQYRITPYYIARHPDATQKAPSFPSILF